MDERLKAALDKVTKLRALGDRATTQAEREAAYAQAEAIIAKYQIDVAQIEAHTNGAAEEMSLADDALWSGAQATSWVGMLGLRLANIHGCAAVWSRRADVTRLILAGRPSDVAIVRYMFAWLHGEIARLSEREHGKAAKNAFRLGATVGACDAMMRAQKQESDAAAPVQGQGAAMVLVSRAEAAHVLFGKVGAASGGGISMSDDGAFLRGHRAGRDLSPRAGLSGGGHRMLGSGE